MMSVVVVMIAVFFTECSAFKLANSVHIDSDSELSSEAQLQTQEEGTQELRGGSDNNNLHQLLNSTDVDQVMQGIELQKVDAKIKEYLKGNKEVDEQDEREFKGIEEKLAVGIKNANQGEMGFPFAQTKINDIKKSLLAMKENAIEETEEGLKIWREVQNLDQKALVKNEIKLNIFDTLAPKIQRIVGMFPQILKLEKQIELIKNDGQDDELQDFESTFNEQLGKINEVQSMIQKEQKESESSQKKQQVAQEDQGQDKENTQEIISEYDDKLYTNPNQGISMSELRAKSNTEVGQGQGESEEQGAAGGAESDESQAKDQDQDAKPENNVNLQTGEQQGPDPTSKQKRSQWQKDGDFLAYTNY